MHLRPPCLHSWQVGSDALELSAQLKSLEKHMGKAVVTGEQLRVDLVAEKARAQSAEGAGAELKEQLAAATSTRLTLEQELSDTRGSLTEQMAEVCVVGGGWQRQARMWIPGGVGLVEVGTVSVCKLCKLFRPHTRARAHTHTHTHALMHMHTLMHTHMRTRTRTCTHTRSHSRIHTRSCTCLLTLLQLPAHFTL